MIKITENIEIDEFLIKEDFIRSSGPGGQNVNKVSTAVQLRFNLKECSSISEEIKVRLVKIAGKKIIWDKESNKPEFLVIEASRFRTQDQNRKDAFDRLKELIIRASKKPKKRFDTKPSLASIERRLKRKKKHKKTKELRKKVKFSEEDY